MNQVYVTADTHLSHANIITFEAANRPFATIEAHDRELIARWNQTVRKHDTVWHLGDVFFGQGHELLAELNGHKHLVMGNHDHHPIELYQRYFRKILGAVKLSGCILTHVPVHPYQLERRFRANIHGHSHSFKLNDPRYVCVSVEQTDLRPVALQQIIQGLPKE
jgi:calcineurin-like phosphoesterase family protein